LNNKSVKFSIDNYDLLIQIEEAIKNKTSLSVIRKGDGENVIIGYNVIKGIKLIKYLRKLRHFNIRRFDIKFQKYFKNELIESFKNADYLGVAKDYSYSSIRKFDSDITSYYKLDRKELVDSHFHLEFVKNPNNNDLINPNAQRLISNKKIGIISHLNISKFLKYHNSNIIAQFSIPKRDAGLFNKMNMRKFKGIANSISAVKKDIDVWFLAAGAYAKPFSNYIKNQNGIAIDIGSAIDTWAGEYHSRKYLRELKKHKSQ
tara:strand:- start:232 stop:1011 length:780 start_codon:yes stop_codon:yes gene_type:complete